jgi:putative DNA primase/helicase
VAVLPTTEILEALTNREDRPWSEWSHGRPLSARGLASLLRRFGVRPGNRRDGATVVKGYLRADFEAVWERYLSECSGCEMPLSATRYTSATPKSLAINDVAE